MGKRGPVKECTYTVKVHLNDEQWRYVSNLAALTGMSRSAVVRAIVDSEATAKHDYAVSGDGRGSLVTIHEFEEAKK